VGSSRTGMGALSLPIVFRLAALLRGVLQWAMVSGWSGVIPHARHALSQGGFPFVGSFSGFRR